MEPQRPQYMAPNLMELPHSLFLDLAVELAPLRNLIVEFYPYFTDRDYEQTVKRLIKSITHKADIDYQLAEFSISTMENHFQCYGMASEAKLFEVQQLLVAVGRAVYNKINGMSGYVCDVFPYVYSGMQLNCEVFLRNVSQLNYDIELNHKPFEFML